jgi:hypothetical protein
LLHGDGAIRFALPAAGTSPTTEAPSPATSASALDEWNALTVFGHRETLMDVAHPMAVQ